MTSALSEPASDKKMAETYGNIAVRNKAHKLLDKTSAYTAKLPVRLSNVLEEIGYKYAEFLVTRETQRILGAVSYSKKTIYINSEERDENKHFTLAHEIGHAVLHPQSDRVDYRSVTQDHLSKEARVLEREANVFAFELVLPYPEFIDDYRELNGDIARLSKIYLVAEKKIKERVAFLSKQVEEGRIEPFI